MLKLSSLTLALGTLALVLAVVLRSGTAIGQTAQTQPEIKVDNFTFSPETLTVAANTTITWTNKDDVPHVIASTDGLFRSKGLDTDDHYSFKFTKPGTYNYFCAIHPKMTGKIVVQ
ncbi:MAG TPA: cupredoxin family copper-binding protein [Terriglobales bacterium]|nr:cupredoxin family copper-binding protein [Terriglobales bacterium]